ncbi:MAG: hypothetical protein AB1679_15260 [Actinomycetota bacterium]
MNGPTQSRRGRCFLLLAPLLLATVVPAGRSDAAEDTKVSATTVAQALKTIERAGGDIAAHAAADKAKAEHGVEVIEPLWKMIEGTIRANDPNSYAAFEDAVADLGAAAKAGDARKAGGAAGALSSAVQFYVAKFPGEAGPTAGAPRGPAAAAAAASKPAPKQAASADKTPAPAEDRQAAAVSPAAEAGDATLARTGPSSALAALAGAALGLGGLGLIGGARRRRSSPTA